jgi:HPt (histidine-containing phosphotransfer) domain-containing protein
MSQTSAPQDDQYTIIFNALQSSYGLKPSSATDLMMSFLDGVRSNTNELKQLLERRDLEQLRKVAHAFKSLCLSYQAKECASFCEQLETAIKSADWHEIETRNLALNENVEKLLDDFGKHAQVIG